MIQKEIFMIIVEIKDEYWRKEAFLEILGEIDHVFVGTS